jgi:hypothetical protein
LNCIRSEKQFSIDEIREQVRQALMRDLPLYGVPDEVIDVAIRETLQHIAQKQRW